MKKRLATLLITILLFASFTPGFASMERAKLPKSPVTFNGTSIDNQRATYPLIVYKNITYFPMTWDYATALGLSSNYTEARGLVIEKSSSSVNLVQSVTANNDPNASYAVSLPYFPITVNGKRIDNGKETYPLLLFRNITYFPLTWAFAVTEFGWEYSYNNVIGLQIVTHPFQPTSTQHEQKTLNYGNGDNYVGEVLFSKKDGIGTFTWANGDYYSGEWKTGQKHGTGILVRVNGNSYSGDWHFDEKNGVGTVTMSNGDRYVGDLIKATYSGIGTYTWANGDAYQGVWLHGERTGDGNFTFANGDQYIGEFKEGKYDGYGKLTKADGGITEGTWNKGTLSKSMPQAPSNISLEVVSDNKITFHWTPAANTNYATLYVATTPTGPWMEVRYPDGLEIKLRGSGYVYSEAVRDQNYYFKMITTSSGVESKDSMIVSANTSDDGNQVTHHVIQSQIKYEFEGFGYENAFQLSNGQVWKQTSHETKTAKRFMPDVLIFLDDNEYKMIVEGYEEKLTVVRVK